MSSNQHVMIPDDIEKRLFEDRVGQITDKRFFEFAIKDYLTVTLADVIEVNDLPKNRILEVEFDYAIPILQYYWINNYDGKEWKNQVQEYLCIFRNEANDQLNLTDSLTVKDNKIFFGGFHHLGFSRSGIDSTIHWADKSKPYQYQINALRMSGVYDLSMLLAIGKNCSNNEDAAAFIKFGYDESKYRSHQESVIVANKELASLEERLKILASGYDNNATRNP